MFLGHPRQPHYTPVEQAMDDLLRVAARSTLRVLADTGLFSGMTVVTNDPEFVAFDGVRIYATDPTYYADFHVGQVLREVVRDFKPDSLVVYVGGGAGLLLNPTEWQALVAAVESTPATVTANNYFSADLVGWQPAKALLQLSEADLPDSDNNLAFALCRRAGLKWRQMLPGNSRTSSTLFDIDTPTDAALLKLWLAHQAPETRPALREFLTNTTAFDKIPLAQVLKTLGNFEGEILVCGRISGSVHRLLETTSHGQTRVLSEERGMRASGREAEGKVVSLAGFMLDALGTAEFFKQLARTAQAAIIDSRVLFSHQKLRPGRGDRFNSDAFEPAAIVDPKVRAFTEAALEAQTRWNFPVVLGGHSAVAGGLMLLLDLVPPRVYD